MNKPQAEGNANSRQYSWACSSNKHFSCSAIPDCRNLRKKVTFISPIKNKKLNTNVRFIWSHFCLSVWLKSAVFHLCCHLCSKSAIAVICGIINSTWVVVQHRAAWMNTMFEETVLLSVTAPVWILTFRITDYSFWKYEQHNNFHWKM